jgi:uncharacterized protein (UPF0297 family)
MNWKYIDPVHWFDKTVEYDVESSLSTSLRDKLKNKLKAVGSGLAVIGIFIGGGLVIPSIYFASKCSDYTENVMRTYNSLLEKGYSKKQLDALM